MDEQTAELSFVPLSTGNVRDDDAQYVDELVTSMASPQQSDDLPTEKITTRRAKPVATTSVRAGRVTLLPLSLGGVPMLALPADPNRVGLLIRAEAVGTADPADLVLVASDASLAQSDYTAIAVKPGAEWTDLRGHTGPVYVAAVMAVSNLSANIFFSAVTR